MKKSTILFIFFLCFSSTVGSQSLVVQYVYSKRIMKDSVKITSQNTFLNIKENTSTFFSEAPYLADSIIASDQKLGRKVNFKALPGDLLSCYIKKDISSKKIIYYSDEFDEHEYKYEENPDFKWEIAKKENKEILGFKVYAASTNYAGRKYYAYFTTELPIQDGPYKFCGLPGLILEIFDEKNDHHFLATGISKENKISIDDYITKRKYIETSKEKFIEMRKNHAEAPLKRMFEMMNSNQIYEKKDANGTIIDIRKVLGETQRKMIEEYKKENKIEL